MYAQTHIYTHVCGNSILRILCQDVRIPECNKIPEMLQSTRAAKQKFRVKKLRKKAERVG